MASAEQPLLLAAAQRPGGSLSLLAVAMLVGVALLDRRVGRSAAAASLPAGARLRTVLALWAEVGVMVALLAPLSIHEAGVSGLAGGAAIVGLVLGVPAGLLRAGTTYLGAAPEAKAVVLRRNRSELAYLPLAVVLWLAGSWIVGTGKSAVAVAAALVAAQLCSQALLHATAVTLRYLTDVQAPRR